MKLRKGAVMSTERNNDREVKISVIMPVYNAGEYLCRAVEDLMHQSFSDFELICVNDGSTDDSYDILEEIERRDSRLVLLSEKNFGPSVARNKGLEVARGKYVIFLDADDMFEPTLLEDLYNLAEREELDIAVTEFDIYNDSQNKRVPSVDEPHAYIFDGEKVTSKNEHPEYILTSATGYVWNKMFRASFLQDKRLTFDPDLYVFEDVHFVCSAMATAERVAKIKGPRVHHRIYSEQSRAILFRKYYGQVPVVYSKIREFLMQRGMYIPLKKCYLNLSAGRCFKIYHLLWNDGKERMWNMLHSKYAEEMDWLGHEKESFESMEVYEFVANVVLYTYEEYQQREEQGKIIDVEKLDKENLNKKVTEQQKISRRRALWNKITSLFGKKN